MIVLLTRPPKLFFPGFIIYFLKVGSRKILGRTRGPDAVLKSLMCGLDEIHEPYSLNAKPSTGDVVHVLSNIEALKWAIDKVKSGKISHLIAGPNLVIIPTENNNILNNQHIDAVLTTSAWNKNFYSSLLRRPMQSIYIWPAGVKVPPKTFDHKNNVIVFKKKVPEEIFQKVSQTLKEKRIPFSVLEYGKFSQQEYFNTLISAKFMIYLQEIESQGIALQEAWIRNVPTLVWNKGMYTFPDGHVVSGNICAPFLTDQSGMLFGSSHEFDQKLDEFTQNLHLFTPYEYCNANLSNKASAETYVKIVRSICL